MISRSILAPKSILRFLFSSFPYSLIASVTLLGQLALADNSFWQDNANLAKVISDQQQEIYQLETEFGRSHQSLVEPLSFLAKQQINANQFDEANATLDKAVQIVRINNGLFTGAQYDLLQRQIENERIRDNWKFIRQSLEHLAWLYRKQFDGTANARVQRLMWLSDAYLEAVFEDSEEHAALNLRKATQLNEVAIEVAAQEAYVPAELAIQSHFSLLQKYYLESLGIRKGGRLSYQIREIVPDSGFLDKPKTALRKRFRGGLRTLDQAGEILQASADYDAVAMAMIDLHTADWKLLYNEMKDPAAEYLAVFNTLKQVGLDDEQLAELFARPELLPSQNLIRVVNMKAPDNQQELLKVLAVSKSFPGYVRLHEAMPSTPWKQEDMQSITATLTLEPTRKSGYWSNQKYHSSLAGSSQVSIIEHSAADDASIRTAIDAINALRFRPVLAAGKPIDQVLTIELLYHGNNAEVEDHVLVSAR